MIHLKTKLHASDMGFMLWEQNSTPRACRAFGGVQSSAGHKMQFSALLTRVFARVFAIGMTTKGWHFSQSTPESRGYARSMHTYMDTES
mmetsp:Transcript_19269/g.37779  ORF Transcript_19269/g.37779 Transcript_19269/m.37779 type:complete len:89 (+) Transcript_19269:150-416(+)